MVLFDCFGKLRGTTNVLKQEVIGMNFTPSGLVVGTQPKKCLAPKSYAAAHVCVI
jgi:hypothetical protein